MASRSVGRSLDVTMSTLEYYGCRSFGFRSTYGGVMVAHTSSDSGLVPTSLGRLNVGQAGAGLCGAGTQDGEGRSPPASASGTERGVETWIAVGTRVASGATERPRCSILVTKGDVIARTSAP